MKHYQIGIRTLAVFGILGVVAGLLFGLNTFAFSLGCFIAAAVLYPQVNNSILFAKEAELTATKMWVLKDLAAVSPDRKLVILNFVMMGDPEFPLLLKVHKDHPDWERFCKLKPGVIVEFSARDKDKPLDTKGEISSFLEIHQTYPAGHRFAR